MNLPSRMLTHGSFELLRHLPTILVAVVLVCSLVLLVVLTCCEGREGQSDTETFLYSAVSLIVGDWIQCEKSDNKLKYYIKTGDGAKEGCELKFRVLIILFVYAIILVVFAIVTFFELFLFSTSSTCSTNSWTFCFPTGDSSAERIRNCTVLEGDVICYQLELNIVTPAGVIGGLFTIINFLTTSLNYRVIKYYCNEENKRRNCLVALYIILLFSLLAMLVVCCILGAISRLKNDSPTSDVIVFIFQYISVILAILLGGFIPMISVLCN